METIVWTILDILLITLLLALGWASLVSKDLRQAVVLFIGFGLLLALVWVRLRAPDIALAEAAVGAGLTGALLLTALRDEASASPGTAKESLPDAHLPGQRVLLTVLSAGLALVLGWAFVYALSHADPARLAYVVLNNLEHTGVSNPVTAVLLDYRAYDTLLELAVLLAAVLGILALGPARSGYVASDPVLSGLTRWLVPILILVSGYLLWVGAQAPGGAFQAGALLATAGVLLRLTGDPSGGLPREIVHRGLLVAGLALFLTIGLTLMLAGRAFLDYPVAWAGSLILVIETAATLGIAATLVTAFVCGEPDQWSEKCETSLSAGPRSPSEIKAGESS